MLNAKLILAALLAIAAGDAHAQAYVHLGPAQAKVETSTGISDTETKPYAAAGYRFTEHLALEASYLVTGAVRGSSSGISRTWQASGPGIAAIGTLPIAGGVSLVGKIAVYSLKAESTDSTMGGVPGTGPPPPKVDLGTRPARRRPRLKIR